MFTAQDIVASLARENVILKHLYSKVTPEIADYRLSDSQRSIRELLIYMTTMGSNMVTSLQAGAYDFALVKEVTEKQAARGIESFPQMMDEQHEIVSAYLLGLSQEDLDKEYNLFGMGNQTARQYILEVIVKNFPAYRMMLFLLLKSAGVQNL